MQQLYRHWGENDELLYIGRSTDFLARNYGHKQKSPWFPLIRKITVEHYETKEAVIGAEKAAIIAERPIYNKDHIQPRAKWRKKVEEPKIEEVVIEETMPILYLVDEAARYLRYYVANAPRLKIGA